jgi:uncharacterized membrane protein
MVSHRMGDQNLLSQTPPCFGRHVKPLVPAAFVSTHSMSGRQPVVKIIAKSFSQYDEKHVVPTPLSGIRVGKRRKINLKCLKQAHYGYKPAYYVFLI